MRAFRLLSMMVHTSAPIKSLPNLGVVAPSTRERDRAREKADRDRKKKGQRTKDEKGTERRRSERGPRKGALSLGPDDEVVMLEQHRVIHCQVSGAMGKF